MAQQILNSWGQLPPDAAPYQVDYLWQGRVNAENPDDGIVDRALTYPVSTRVSFQRQLSAGPEKQAFPVWGPGGSMSVVLGENGVPQRVFQEGWRQLVPSKAVDVMDIQEVINQLNERGSDATLNGITLYTKSIEIVGVDLGYWEPDCDVKLPAVRPVYVLDTLIQEILGGQSMYQMYVYADEPGPGAEIQEPREGTCFKWGEEVCVVGTATGGVLPLTFEWFDADGNLLGTGPQICFPMPSPPLGHSVFDTEPSVKLVVTDASGAESTDERSLCSNDATSTPALPRSVQLEQNHPNPFNPTTQIVFSIPAIENGGGGVATRLRVYDAQGRMVRALVDEVKQTGRYQVKGDGRDGSGRAMASGVYYYRLQAGEKVLTRRMVLIK